MLDFREHFKQPISAKTPKSIPQKTKRTPSQKRQTAEITGLGCRCNGYKKLFSLCRKASKESSSSDKGLVNNQLIIERTGLNSNGLKDDVDHVQDEKRKNYLESFDYFHSKI